jgi:hypothetical protein
MKQTHISRITRSDDMDCVLTQGIDFTGKNAWYVVKLDKLKAPLFHAEIAKGMALMLTDYGTILQSGYGTSPDGING